ELWNITPDMTALGKYLGGGFAFGAFGGRADIMDRLDYVAADRYFHTGTHNNNPVTMRVAYTALTEVATPDALDRLNRRGDRLRGALNGLAAKRDARAHATGLGSLCDIHFCRGPIDKVSDLSTDDRGLQRLFYLAMTLRGFFVSRRGSIALSFDITDHHVDEFIDATDQFFCEYSAFLL
ncbi:MAG: aminotransferase class III-fold pyridoxal phosphate-dependent enzyme, partial [Caulobacterales bacterium]|nr:aminotransferase class III-fold pyridoxal phosphate-dependent enzyme [Caulobacterales bacterium]